MLDGSQVRLQVWDTAGQERFRAITMAYYRQSQGIFLVYNCCDMSSLENAKTVWLPDIRRYASKNAKIMLVGSKVDNIDATRQKGIDTEAIRAEAKAFAKQNGLFFIETSAKDNRYVDAAFMSLAKELKDQAVSGRRATKTVRVNKSERPRSFFAKLCDLLGNNSKRRHPRRQYR